MKRNNKIYYGGLMIIVTISIFLLLPILEILTAFETFLIGMGVGFGYFILYKIISKLITKRNDSRN